jgi:hypothetical protein
MVLIDLPTSTQAKSPQTRSTSSLSSQSRPGHQVDRAFSLNYGEVSAADSGQESHAEQARGSESRSRVEDNGLICKPYGASVVVSWGDAVYWQEAL